jgi:hypothetical protein
MNRYDERMGYETLEANKCEGLLTQQKETYPDRMSCRWASLATSGCVHLAFDRQPITPAANVALARPPAITAT